MIKNGKKNYRPWMDRRRGGVLKKERNLHSVAETEVSGGHSCISAHASVASLAEMRASLTQIGVDKDTSYLKYFLYCQLQFYILLVLYTKLGSNVTSISKYFITIKFTEKYIIEISVT